MQPQIQTFKLQEMAILGRNNKKTFDDYWPAIKVDPFLGDFVAIADYLREGPRNVLIALKELERMLELKCSQHAKYQARVVYTAAISYQKARMQGFQANDLRRVEQLKASTQGVFRKLLTEVLEEHEDAAGFTHLNNGRLVPTVLKFLSKQEFSGDLISKGLQFKDPGAKVDHGEFTHRIQWFLITSGARTSHHTCEVFKKVATYTPLWPASITKGTPEKRTKDFAYAVFGLWDALVDRLGPSDLQHKAGFDFICESVTDFRSPEILYKWLIEDPQAHNEVPLLSAILGARRAKRTMQKEKAKSIPPNAYNVPGDFHFLNKISDFTKIDLEYLADHIYSKSFKDLNGEQKVTVCTIYRDSAMLKDNKKFL
jgi:hypothetical protein